MKSNRHLWHPATLFVLLSLLTVWISWVMSVYGVHTTHPLTHLPVEIENLMSAEGVRWMVRHAVDHFLRFAPVGHLILWVAALGLWMESGCCDAVIHYATQTRQRRRALLHAAIVVALYVGVIGAATLCTGGILRSADGTLRHSAFMDGWPMLAATIVGLAGMTYGLSSGSYRTDRDLVGGMLRYARPLTEYLLTAFVAAQWVACLHQSQLDTYLAAQWGLYRLCPDLLHHLPRIFAYLLLIFPFCFTNLKKKP